MGILSWIVLGLVAGVLAKFLMPGPDPGGLIVTVIIGVVGALIGGMISTAVGFGDVTGINGASVVIATGGALLLLMVYRRFRG